MRARGLVKEIISRRPCEACAGAGFVVETGIEVHDHVGPDGEYLGSESVPYPIQAQCPNPKCYQGEEWVDSYWIECEDEEELFDELFFIHGAEDQPERGRFVMLKEVWTADGRRKDRCSW